MPKFIIKKSETQIQEEIGNYLVIMGWLVVRVNSGRATIHGRYFRAYRIFGRSKKYESSGFPDLQAFKNDKYLLLEVKKPKEKQNDNQIRFEKFAKECGAKIHVVRSVDDVIEILKQEK